MSIIVWAEGWNFIRDTITDVMKNNDTITPKQFMEAYTYIFTMSTQSPPHDYRMLLYNRYQLTLEEYARTVVLPPIRISQGDSMLRDLVKQWSEYKRKVRLLSGLFNYLDRYYVKRYNYPSLSEVGINCFLSKVYHVVKSEAMKALNCLICRQSEGEQANERSVLLKDIRSVLEEMGCENDYMLEADGLRYRSMASNWMSSADSCTDYMLKVEEFLNLMKNKVLGDVFERIQYEFLSRQATKLLEECRILLRRGSMADDLSRMYRLFSKSEKDLLTSMFQVFREHVAAESRTLVEANSTSGRSRSQEQALIRQVMHLHDTYLAYVRECFQDNKLFHKALEPLSRIFSNQVLAQGTALVERAAANLHKRSFVAELIKLHDNHMSYVDEYFHSSGLFIKALKDAFDIICNKSIRGRSIAELLAAFADRILHKSGKKKLSDEAVEEVLENVVKLLVYVSDKDHTSEFCRKRLAQRLLFNRSDDASHERRFLAKLNQLFGGLFTSKMEGMLDDLARSRENKAAFDQYLLDNPSRGCTGFTVTILTTWFWPSYIKPSGLRLPAELARRVETFREFYQAKTNYRKLKWIHSLGTCTLSGTFLSKTVELVLTTYQASTLLLFNDCDRLSYSEIASQLNLKDEDMSTVLHSLSCANYQILNKVPDVKSVSGDDYFEFNSGFTCRSKKIKVSRPPSSTVDQKRKQTEDVSKEQKYAIDACLVRIMKSRKVLDHQQLVLRCVEQLSGMFKPDMKKIKNQIEDLISRGFLARDDDNHNVFKYLA